MAVAPSQHLLNTFESQPALVERLLADKHPVAEAAARLRGARRVYLVGTGTSYHGAQVGVAIARSIGHGVPLWEATLPLLPETVAAGVSARNRCEDAIADLDLSLPSHFLGGGPAWATASEGALKLREAAHVQAEGHQL